MLYDNRIVICLLPYNIKQIIHVEYLRQVGKFVPSTRTKVICCDNKIQIFVQTELKFLMWYILCKNAILFEQQEVWLKLHSTAQLQQLITDM